MDLLCFSSVLCLLCLCARLFICALWSPAGKGLTSWLSFVVSTVSLSLSHWYPGSGVVLDCIDSLSLHLYLLLFSSYLNYIILSSFMSFKTYNCGQINKSILLFKKVGTINMFCKTTCALIMPFNNNY